MKYVLTVSTLLTALLSTHAVAEGWRDQYKTIRFGVLSGENEADRVARQEGFEKYLEKELGVDVELFTAGSYDGVIQALAADQIEFSFLGSSAYAAAYTETNGGVIPLTAKQESDGSTGYYSIVVVRCDSGYKSLADLKGKVLAFADPDSTSGYAVPFFNMVKQGYDPKTYFSATPFSGSHEGGVTGVVNHQYDAAATNEANDTNGVPQRMVSKGMIGKDEVCKIWTSPEITNGPFTARANLPKDLIEEMQKVMLAFPQKDPAAFKAQDGGDVATAKGYVPVDHSRYEWIIEMRDWLKEQRRSG